MKNSMSCQFLGNVYFVVKTALGINTKRKRQMPEKKAVSNFDLAESPKTPNKRAPN